MDFASSAQIIRTALSEDFSTAEARETSLLDSESEFFTVVQEDQEEDGEKDECNTSFRLAETTILSTVSRIGEENAVEVGLDDAGDSSTKGTLKALLSLDEHEEGDDDHQDSGAEGARGDHWHP